MTDHCLTTVHPAKVSESAAETPRRRQLRPPKRPRRRYLIGRMGGVRVMVMTNSRPEGENDTSHVLMFAEAPHYNQSQAATPAEPSRPTPAHRRARRGEEKQQMDDDPVPF
jgi:hypothetical protein